MAVSYDFDKTILNQYNRGKERGVAMVDKAEKVRQFEAITKFKERSMVMIEDEFARAAESRKHIKSEVERRQQYDRDLVSYDKAIEAQGEYMEGLGLLDKDWWSWEALGNDFDAIFGTGTTAEESYKKRMQREGTTALKKPERFIPQYNESIYGNQALLQILSQLEHVDVGDASNRELMDMLSIF